MGTRKNLVNLTFGRLIVLAECSFNNKLCWTQCSCGKEISFLYKRASLMSGDRKSCGCLVTEISRVNVAKAHKSNIRYKTEEEFKANRSKLSKKYYNENPELSRELGREVAKKRRKKQSKYYCDKLKSDVTWRLRHNIRSRLRKVLKRTNNKKNSKTAELLGCDIQFFREYLTERFTEGMSWDNYGKWHIDHIIPLSHFDLSDESQVRKAFHYTNCQPMWARENSSKGNRYSGKYLLDK